MIFITAKFRVRPEYADQWMDIVDEFTQAVRAEPGCLWFDWSRSVADPNEYVLVEAYRDDDAAAAHVNADHFAKRSEEHTSELQSRFELVCRLRLDKKDLHQRGARG